MIVKNISIIFCLFNKIVVDVQIVVYVLIIVCILMIVPVLIVEPAILLCFDLHIVLLY